MSIESWIVTLPDGAMLTHVFDSKADVDRWLKTHPEHDATACVVERIAPHLSVGYIEELRVLHERNRLVRSYVQILTSDQRDYLHKHGYISGPTGECYWFEKSKTSE